MIETDRSLLWHSLGSLSQETVVPGGKRQSFEYFQGRHGTAFFGYLYSQWRCQRYASLSYGGTLKEPQWNATFIPHSMSLFSWPTMTAWHNYRTNNNVDFLSARYLWWCKSLIKYMHSALIKSKTHQAALAIEAFSFKTPRLGWSNYRTQRPAGLKEVSISLKRVKQL